MSSRQKRQQYRIFIHGHSFRHVFGTSEKSEVVDWFVKLYKGEQPPFMRQSSVYDWTVEHRTEFGWEPISKQSKQSLLEAINKRL